MKCPNCPIAGPCMSERPGYEFACKFAEGTDAERLWLVSRSARLEGEPIEYPSLATQAGNLAKAVGRFVASGLKRVDEETYQERLAICQACPLYDAVRKRCVRCGCKTTAKLRMASESCPHPDGPRWGPSTGQGVGPSDGSAEVDL
jgi:hypothetical protein